MVGGWQRDLRRVGCDKYHYHDLHQLVMFSVAKGSAEVVISIIFRSRSRGVGGGKTTRDKISAAACRTRLTNVFRAPGVICLIQRICSDGKENVTDGDRTAESPQPVVINKSGG